MVKGQKEAPPPKEGEAAEEATEGGKQEGEGAKQDEEVPPGVPEFWLNVLRNCEDIGEKVGLGVCTSGGVSRLSIRRSEPPALSCHERLPAGTWRTCVIDNLRSYPTDMLYTSEQRLGGKPERASCRTAAAQLRHQSAAIGQI